MIRLARLDNGLTVVVRPMPTPLVAVALRIEAGSADEDPDQHGAAHFLEHMVFKGTERRGVGVVAAEIESLGGDLNAYTTVDHTVLHATVPADPEGRAVQTTLDVIADMALRSVIDPEETASEREVILEEIRSYADDPASVIADLASAHLFPGHPYGRPVTGTEATVAVLDHAHLRAFHERCWGARRAVLAIAGDVNVDAVLAAARQHFAAWSPGAPPAPHPPPPPPDRGWHAIASSFDSPVVELAWATPHDKHPDLPALAVACALIGQGSASLLPVRLQLELELVTDVWSALSTFPRAGYLSIGLSPHPGHTAEAVHAVRETLATLATRPRPGDVRRARESLLADVLYADETVDGVVMDLIHWTATRGSPEARQAERAAIASVTPADVARVVATWLDPDAAVVAATEPAPPPRPVAVAPRPGPRRIVRDDGVVVVLLPDDAPVASIRCAGLGGALAVSSPQAGIASAWAAMVEAGAGHLDAEGYARAVDGLSGSVTAVAGRNSVGLAASFPADRFREGLDLWGLALTAPRFDAAQWRRVQDTMLEDLRTLGDRPGDVLWLRTWAALWRGHPWRLPPGGTPASVRRLTTGALSRWHRGLLTADNLVVAVTGGFDPDEIVDALDPWLGRLPPGPYALPPRPVPNPPVGRRIRARAGHEQAWVQLAARGPAGDAPDRDAVDLAVAILGGQGGPLFLALRERRGLAYHVWASAVPGWDGGVLAFGLATEPRQRGRAVAALRGELERFAEEGPDERDLARARAGLVGSAAMGWQRAAGRAAEVALSERYGLSWGVEAYRARLAELDREAVRTALASRLDDLIEVVVTPRRSGRPS